MVYVNSKKFACEACIKGHRSSGCSHTDRPLFEVKKKGRPVSQCERCRELRHSRKMHSKCTCSSGSNETIPRASTSFGRPRRFIPIAPALPNGIKDIIQSRGPSQPADVRQRVDTLLNPCICQSFGKCRCKEESQCTRITPRPLSRSNSGLSALVKAAEMVEVPRDSRFGKSTPSLTPPSRPGSPPLKRSKEMHVETNARLELPPILVSDPSSMFFPSVIHTFDTMPPMSTIISLAGSGCTCGVTCACPGCSEHRGPEHADESHGDCAHGACGNCIDNFHDISLPGQNFPASSTSSTTRSGLSSIMERFLARAAALPAPPPNRKIGRGTQIDPTNVIVYPSAAMDNQHRRMTFGLVSVPKLECCGGHCGCPNGVCGCGKACNGWCCEHGGGASVDSALRSGRVAQTVAYDIPADSPAVLVPAVRSCCAGKA